MQSTTSPIWQPRVLHIFVMMERLTGSPRDIFANVAVDMPALRRNCVLFMPLSINIFQRLLYVTLMCHYPIVMTYIISFRVSRSKHHVHFLIQWFMVFLDGCPVLPFFGRRLHRVSACLATTRVRKRGPCPRSRLPVASKSPSSVVRRPHGSLREHDGLGFRSCAEADWPQDDVDAMS